MTRRQRPEDVQQKALVADIRSAVPKIWFFHVPNQSKAHPRWRSNLRLLGLSTGVPDLVIETPTYHAPRGCRIEMKSDDGDLSDAQKDWRAYYASIGVPFATIRSSNEGILWLRSLWYWL